MKKIEFQFRSVRIDHMEKPALNARGAVTVMGMDPESSEKHSLELSLSEIFSGNVWLSNMFVPLMILTAFAGISYAAIVLGADSNFFSSSGYCFFYALFNFILFLSIWTGFVYRASIRDKKNQLVNNSRGKGNWKIIDEEKWDDFKRLLDISVKRRKEDEEKEIE